MKIIWIASYPKSGNTLVRLLLSNYLFGEAGNTDLVNDRIPGLHQLLAENTPSPLRSIGIKLGMKWLSTNHTLIDLSGDGVKFVKSHFMWSDRHPYAEQTAGFVYILRNPRDVLLSNARYLGVGSSIDDQRKFADMFIRKMGVSRWANMGMGTWPEHATSWLSSADNMPHVFVRYEDLRAETEQCLADIIRLFGQEPEAGRLRAAVSSSDIEKARIHETSEKALGRTRFYGTHDGSRFVGEGRMGQSLEMIGSDVESRFRDRFGPLIEKYGYT